MNEKWLEMQEALSKSGLSNGAVMLLLRNYGSIDEIIEKGEYHLWNINHCGKKRFCEISKYLYENKYIPAQWTEETVKIKSKDLTDLEKIYLRERFAEELTYEQIGRKHGVTKQRAERVLHKATQKAAREYILFGEEKRRSVCQKV